MSSGGGDSPTPNRTCTGVITSTVQMWLVANQYSVNSGQWQTTPPTSVAANQTSTIFVANGTSPNGSVTYATADGTQFVMVFSMNGSNTANIMGNLGSPQAYQYDKTFPTTGDTITVTFTVSQQH
jgi:VCBS repeat-containing protein